MEKIHAEIELNEEVQNVMMDLAIENEEFQKSRKSLRFLLCTGGACFLILGLVTGVKILVVMIGIGFILAGLFLTEKLQRAILTKRRSKLDPKLTSGKRSYDFDETGVDITSEVGHGHTNWDAFIEYGRKEKYLWIRRGDQQMLMIDEETLTAELSAQLQDLLSTHISSK